ncbi:MAG: tetraacyldisaccharide 4'-kinase [Bryobacteraceae bacterium]|nr:tetraacyldisaccharide 4'-kinase [Bryobacteraceae bacterium]
MRLRLIYLLYRLLQWVALPVIVVYFVRRVLRDRRYRRGFPERLGFVSSKWKQDAPGAIWLHAVSVGEVMSLVGLLRRLRSRLPEVPLFVSTSTVAGREVAEQRLGALADGIFFAPLDYCFAVRRVLRTLRPSLVVVAETEIWPNLYREVKRAGAGLLLVNARISDRTAPTYARWRWFFAPVLGLADRILAQSRTSLERFRALTTQPERVEYGGNLKYDFEAGAVELPGAVRTFLERVRPTEVVIAASTMPPAFPGDVDEDEEAIAAFRELSARHAALLWIHVPRKPDSFDAAAAKLARAGVRFVRRSHLEREGAEFRLPGVLLLDSVGELLSLFAVADVVFMGGTLARRGGHNILEPAFFGRPIVIGPHMENFPEIVAEFRAAGACVEIASGAQLAETLERLLSDADLRAELGRRAQRVAASNRGAAERAAEAALQLYQQTVPRYLPPGPAWPILGLLSWVWRGASATKRAWNIARRERLATPVISVGNLSLGGTGKTPFVAWLADKLSGMGFRPAILTRGYGRRIRKDPLVVAAGESVPAEQTGDEAQILIRSVCAPVGISGRRAAAGRVVEARFHPDVFLLDDGFQHWRLERDLDIVLLDGLAPFGSNGEVFPLGRLREPLEALRRADAVVVTRAEAACPRKGFEAAVRRYNPSAPVFYSRVVPLYWEDTKTGHRWPPRELPFSRVGAFCGLGNPASFWRTLKRLGREPVFRAQFRDHHRYNEADWRRLRAQALEERVEALLTTEKDACNFSFAIPRDRHEVRVCWLKIGIEVEQEDQLLELLNRLLRDARAGVPKGRPAPARAESV